MATAVQIKAVPSGDPKYPWKVRITTRDEHGRLVGVRNLRQINEAEARKHADQLRTSKEWA